MAARVPEQDLTQTAEARSRGDAPLGQVFQPGEQVGRHTVLASVGKGSFGQVYAAFDAHLKRKVALKLLTQSHHAAHRHRFQREGEALAALAHPNVVSVFDVIEHPRGVVLAMEFVEGQTLTHWAAGRPWREVLGAFLQAARGLSAAHHAGMVHRDFKPDNVMVGVDGRIRVADFGLATRADGPEAEPAGPPSALDAQVSVEGQVVGSPYFLAPEVKAGAKANPSSDQYSYFRSLQLLLEGRPRGEADEKIPPWVDAMVARGLGLGASTRWPDLAAVVKELEARLGIVPELDPYRSLKLRRRVPLGLLVLTLGLYVPVVLIGGPNARTPGMALAIGLLFISVFAVVALLGFRALSHSLAGKRTAAVVALSLVGFVFNRALGFLWDSPVARIFTFDILILGICLTAGALFVHRWMLRPALLSFAGTCVGALQPDWANTTYIGLCALALLEAVRQLRRPDQLRGGFLSSEDRGER